MEMKKGFGVAFKSRKGYAKWFKAMDAKETVLPEVKFRYWLDRDGTPCLEVMDELDDNMVFLIGEEELLALKDACWHVLNKMHKQRKESEEKNLK